MNGRDERLGHELRSLNVPEHRADFHLRLAERISQETPNDRRTLRRPGWTRSPMLLGLSVAAVLVAVVGMTTMLAADRRDVLVEVSGGVKPSSTTVPSAAPSIASRPVPSTSTTRPGMTALTAASTLDLGGLGAVRVGMTPAEATAAAGIPVVASGTADCSYATATGGPVGVAFKMADGRIARVEVRPGSPVKTLSGAGIGDTEAEVQARYSNGLEVSNHKYIPGGHYLTLVPTDAADQGSRLIFETDGTKVTMFRSGTLPQVALVEGCG